MREMLETCTYQDPISGTPNYLAEDFRHEWAMGYLGVAVPT